MIQSQSAVIEKLSNRMEEIDRQCTMDILEFHGVTATGQEDTDLLINESEISYSHRKHPADETASTDNSQALLQKNSKQRTKKFNQLTKDS